MNKPEISIVIPSIRKENIPSIYKSILSSTKRTFELIICGPNQLPQELEQYKNIKNIIDYGSPVRASQIAASLCEGKLITWSADDAIFLSDALDKNIDLLYQMGDNDKNIVVSKYFEGQGWNNNKPL